MDNMISIKDRPIEKANEDQLKVSRYSKALVNFILRSDTPITVGLQGEWGTGKTSMMYMLREELATNNVATSWVNTWEYSMFRGAKETTPAVLNGLLATLEESCGSNWTIRRETEQAMKKVGRFFSNMINQVANNQLGVDVKAAVEATKNEEGISRAEIAQIKKDISGILNTLIEDNKNPYKRVVFFIDDLDRINPIDAVEVLEALKNMFDMDHCIFVLAIDYEVVVKGLESKFGKKTEENEREFRSFFDKIIQVPFSMPTGAYDIDFYLDEKLKSLGMKIPNDLKQLYLDVVKNSVGSNPRSLKRFINTFSLLNTIRREEFDPANDSNPLGTELMLFALLGIQITYPKIFRHIGMNQDFKSWNQPFAARLGLDWNLITEKVQEYGANQLIDDDWEKVVWGLCQSDAYLKSRAFSILELLNSLVEHFGQGLEECMQNALEFAAITSVDDSHDAKQSIVQIGEKRIRFTGLDAKKKQLEDWKSHPNAIKLWYEVVSMIEQNLNNIGSKINFAKTATSFYRWQNGKGGKEIQTFYCDNPKGKYPGLKLVFYGYSKDFIPDTIQIIKEFGWTADEAELTKNGKLEFIQGATLAAPDEKWNLNTHGSIWINYELQNSAGIEKAEHFILTITNKMIDQLKTNPQ
jgi:hypothetical protein